MSDSPELNDLPDDPENELEESAEFQAVLASYLERLERNESLDRQQVLRDHPQFANQLLEFLHDHNRLIATAGPVDLEFGEPEVTHASGTNGFRLAAGQTLQYVGEYRILSEIARGGMGVVFKARQRKLNRIVALKMILSGRLASAEDVQRFHREAQAAAKLRHPNIVSVHEVGEFEGHHYFSMDFIEGRSLAHKLREEAVPAREAAELVRKIALAVHFAHQQGTLHRDLKPANILLDLQGRPHITDFGLAKVTEVGSEDSDSELTTTGAIIGTPSYMSPEQASGLHNMVSAASDVYSLGAILYATLTARAPFVAETPVETLHQVIRQEPVSPASLNPRVPKDLETICLKCLSKEPHQRYGTAQALAEDLQRFLDNRPVMARPAGLLKKSMRWCRRNPVVASLLLLCFLSMGMGTAVSTYFAAHANQRALEAETSRQDTLGALEKADAALKRAEASEAEAIQSRDAADQQRRVALWQTYTSRLQTMQQSLKDKDIAQLDRQLNESVPGKDEPDYRGWEWYFLRDEVERQMQTLVGESEYVFVRWSPGGKQIALRRADGKVEIRESETLELNKIIPSSGQQKFAWHPSGDVLAIAFGQNQVEIWKTSNGEKLATLETPEDDTSEMKDRGIAWHPTGERIALGGPGRLDLWDWPIETPTSQGSAENEVECGYVAEGSLTKPSLLSLPSLPSQTLRSPIPGCSLLAWHPDGAQLCVAGVGYVLNIDVANDKILWKGHQHRVPIQDIAWNHAGTKLAVEWNWPALRVRIYDIDGKVSELPRTEGAGHAIVWSEGDETVISARGHTFVEWNVESGEQVSDRKLHRSVIQSMDLCPRTQRIASVESLGQLRIWGTGPATDSAVEISLPSQGGVVDWSNDCKYVALGSDTNVFIVDVAERKTIRVLKSKTNAVVSELDWHPFKSWLAYQDRNGRVVVWDAESDEVVLDELGDSRDFNRALTWSPNGRFLAAGSGMQWRSDDAAAFDIWDLTTGEKIEGLGNRRPRTRLAWSPDSRFLAVGAFGQPLLELYDLEDRSLVWSKEMPSGVWCLNFSSDGKQLATSLLAGNALILEASDGDEICQLAGHSHNVADISWSPDGNRLLSCSADKTVRIWDAATFTELLIVELPAAVRDCDWNSTANRIALSTSDGIVRVLGTAAMEIPSEIDTVGGTPPPSMVK